MIAALVIVGVAVAWLLLNRVMARDEKVHRPKPRQIEIVFRAEAAKAIAAVEKMRESLLALAPAIQKASRAFNEFAAVCQQAADPEYQARVESGEVDPRFGVCACGAAMDQYGCPFGH